MLDLLAGHGADLNAGDGIITALHAAVFADNVEALEWLISMRASPFVKNVNGDTPLEMAVKLKRKRAEEALRHCNGG
jgi:ankyrin repeat protein